MRMFRLQPFSMVCRMHQMRSAKFSRIVQLWNNGNSELTADLDRKWNGHSVGRWEGDTFVMDSVGFDDSTWLDKFGYAHSDEMRLQERYRRVDADTLELTMTITDPQYYSKPWESDRKVFKLNALQFEKPWDEQIYCVPSEEYKFNRLIRDPASGK